MKGKSKLPKQKAVEDKGMGCHVRTLVSFQFLFSECARQRFESFVEKLFVVNLDVLELL